MKYNETLMNEVSSHELETVEGGFLFLAGMVVGGVIVYVVMSNKDGKVIEGGSSDFLRDDCRMG